MKLSPDSPELTAYLLGELDPDQAAEVETALRHSPELQAELESLRQTGDRLAQEFSMEAALALSPAQRTDLIHSFEQTSDDTATSPTETPRAPSRESLSWGEILQGLTRYWTWATAGAVAIALTALLFTWGNLSIPANQTEHAELRYQTPPAPAADRATLDSLNVQLHKIPANQEQPVDLQQKRSRGEPELRQVVTATKAESELEQITAAPAPLRVVVPPAAADAKKTSELAAAAPTPTSDLYYYQMNPNLARRYGLARRPSLSPGNAPAGAPPATNPLGFGEASDRGLLRVEERLAEESKLVAGRESLNRLTDAPGTESYTTIADNGFLSPLQNPLSTFGLDVDTASYSNVRRFLRDGSLPPPNAVRIEELLNYFRYDYPSPGRGEPFGVNVEISESPWKEGNKLVRIGLQARTVDRRERPPANLVFLLDVSGSMEPENKLPLVKRSLRLLLDRLGDRDSVGIVTYAGQSGVALEPTTVNAEGRARIQQVIDNLRAGGSTAGGAGIMDAYRLAGARFNRESVNRVLLCTDGDFNVGITDRTELQRLIEDKAKSSVFLSVLGYGLGNLKDSTMELLADKGNGNYAYIDSFTEARKVLSEQLEGTLVTVAKDTKVQVEFNPARVRAYRLLGYENRALRARDFNDDTKDAGDVGAGHQVTVLYEIEPATAGLAGVDPLRYQVSAEAGASEVRLNRSRGDELLNLRLRYKEPDASQSRLFETPVKDSDRPLAQTTADYRFAAAVAGYGMMLRQSPHRGELTWETVLRLAEEGLGPDREGYRAEFVDLVRRAQSLAGGAPTPTPAPRF